MNTQRYFDRIGFSATPRPDISTLRTLHRLHPQAIAFENLSSLLGEQVSLEPEAVFDKLVVRGRGGYCFEHNLVFATVLQQIGFDVSAHAARVVWRSPDKTAMGRTHMLLKVLVGDEAWIADVGFGGLTMTAPLRLAPDAEQSTPHETLKITRETDSEREEYRLAAWLNGHWKSMYVFDLVPQYPVDFDIANHYVATHAHSPFRHNLMLGSAGPAGRHAMVNRTYTYYGLDGEKTRDRVTDAGRFLSLVETRFGIRLDGSIDRQKLSARFEDLE